MAIPNAVERAIWALRISLVVVVGFPAGG